MALTQYCLSAQSTYRGRRKVLAARIKTGCMREVEIKAIVLILNPVLLSLEIRM